MIFAKDKGRMCNNILQFGHCYAWAREHGLTAVSMRFCYKYPGFRIRRVRGHNYLTYLWAKYGSAMGLVPVVSFDDPAEDAASVSAKLARLEKAARRLPGAVMAGWQVRHYDLFLKYRDEIVSLFEFADPAPRERRDDEVVLGLHIRRGDYDRWHDGKYFFTDDHYARAVRHFAALVSPSGRRVRVVLATNDRGLDAAAFARSLGDAVSAVEGPADSPVADLRALSQCDYIMGPPSTFSLVGAMYRDVPIRFMTAPEEPFTLDDFSDFAHLFRYEY